MLEQEGGKDIGREWIGISRMPEINRLVPEAGIYMITSNPLALVLLGGLYSGL
jgi:hypothetical protein